MNAAPERAVAARRGPAARAPRRVLAALAAASGLSACGGAASLRPPCQGHARALIAAALHIRPAGLSAARGVGNNSYPQCTYAARGVSVTVNVYDGPQTYFLVERQAIETAQQAGFSGGSSGIPVVQVPGIGEEAYWFPAHAEFLTTDGRRMIDVTVSLARAGPSALQALGEIAARPYLRGAGR
jgi:hypothetical protein